MVNRGSRSTPRTASIARRATSRTRPRTSTGSPPKAAEAPIIRTCKWLAGAAIAAMGLQPVAASARLGIADPARAYVKARAAAMSGDHSQAAQLLAALAISQPGQPDLSKKALSEAIGAGQMELALKLARTIPAAQLPTDARLLLVAEEIRRGRPERAMPWLTVRGDNGDLSFLLALVSAWSLADRGNSEQALATLDQIPSTSVLMPLVGEQRAYILMKAKRTAEAEPFARRAVGSAGGREQRLRLAFADGFLAAGDKPRALMIVEGMGQGEIAARRRIQAGQRGGQAVDNLPRALGEVLTDFSADIARSPACGAAHRPGAGGALRRTRRTAARPRCSRFLLGGARPRHTKPWPCSGRFRPTIPLILPDPGCRRSISRPTTNISMRREQIAASAAARLQCRVRAIIRGLAMCCNR